jgi:hypothetical protein
MESVSVHCIISMMRLLFKVNADHGKMRVNYKFAKCFCCFVSAV